ncbi:MAG: sulfite exporter TauE/SafE family protein [Candidatus Omnitrophica bacterium]|nr:sulfite exporter TauE/SafE family protein [Candidatus Omnitrophota bacterium]MBU1997334.1 sulfite exporter TauE/SafE family protein [Candidatus Omnitrophota bacterium]MBU4332856.1 sulfite exporter TauE/SafE family protein [Candidatus Omnitrophota bacterium]
MEISVGLFLLLVIIAFGSEYIDSAFGMGYGTILSPVLLLLGFNPVVAIIAILLSQACAGFAAAVLHHKAKNVCFSAGSRDLKIVLIMSIFGIISAVFATLITIHLPQIVFKTYIAILVLVMGFIVLSNRKFKFSWVKMIAVGMLSSFNKGICGCCYGPVLIAGQIMAGQKHKNAVGVTTLAEVPICLVTFLTYLISITVAQVRISGADMSVSEVISVMFSQQIFQWELLLALLLGSAIAVPLGVLTTRDLNEKYMHTILGVLIIILGFWAMIEICFIKDLFFFYFKSCGRDLELSCMKQIMFLINL